MRNILILLIVIIGATLFSSCKTRVQYVPVETVKTEYINKLQRDSIFEKDSIYILHRGDTVFKDKYVFRYRDKLVVDTMYCDSIIEIPYEVQLPPVEKEIYPKLLVILAVVGVAGLGYCGFKLIRLFK